MYIPRAALEELNEIPQITYHGMIHPELIDVMMRDTTCVVLPTYYREGVPRVLLEACASGRPIITTDSVGCRDVVEPGINGWKVPSRDVDALTRAMRECAKSGPVKLTSLAIGARETVEARFDEQLVISAYLARLEMASGKKPS